MRVTYIANMAAPYSTENDVRHGFEQAGIEVDIVQENEWRTADQVPEPQSDTIGLLWTHTHGWGPTRGHIVDDALAPYRQAGLPIVGYHLDVWWGLQRQTEVYTQPYFRSLDLFVTADGGSDRLWSDAGIRHRWLPPAVSDRHRLDGQARPDVWPTGIVFVGQYVPNNYHPEWPHRDMMIAHLRKTFGRDFTVLPRRPGDKIRGDDLADVYATAAVVVGDSCFAGVRPRYWSDRVPETLGRGGRLIHPDTDWGGAYETDEHMPGTWRVGDWEGLTRTVRSALNDPTVHDRTAAGQAHTREHHTYTRRADRLALIMEEAHGRN